MVNYDVCIDFNKKQTKIWIQKNTLKKTEVEL